MGKGLLTWVPDFKPVKSSVVPDGTAILLSTIVEHDFLLADGEAALVNVQDVARSSSLAAGVGAGAGTARTNATLVISRKFRKAVG